ncbi:NaeI family type II restriction endonuclease [Embleya sp. NPDC008237]|uniref:NaeI family type II restriction endonuclease n=1 Tax=Embleya sp. NPDC008237 TaxID=3363978 RepID=UPI0036E53E30
MTPPEPTGPVHATATWFRLHDPLHSRFGEALRRSLDEVLDGQRTGRYDVATLEKPEKTYLAAKVGIVCRAAHGFPAGTTHYLVAGHRVHPRFSFTGAWTLPREALGHVGLLLTADDERSRFSVGLLHITEDAVLPGSPERKYRLSPTGRRAIHWLVRSGDLPENFLLHLPAHTRDLILADRVSGQRRINELFRHVRDRIIPREPVATIAHQTDPAKRVRDARRHLRDEGIIILGHQREHPGIARELRLPVPAKGSWISTRIVPARPDDPRPATTIAGTSYVRARPTDTPQPGPADY